MSKTQDNGAREEFSGRVGFVLSCIGSAIGMGNVWMFPYRLGQYGGGAFLLPYILFIVIIGFSGIVGEMAFGRSMQTGPLGAFKKSIDMRGWKFGRNLGVIPVLGSMLIAIGYSVVVGWIICFLKGSITGEILKGDSQEYFNAISGGFGSIIWHALAMLAIFVIMACGVTKGIERVNKILMPIFFVLFTFLAIKVYFTSGSEIGYDYLFRLDIRYLSDPKTWVYALGQAFFSLSLAGSGTIIYGSYLKKSENILYCAGMVSFFDTLGALLASLVIIPSVFSFGLPIQAGPPLLFITMPKILAVGMFGRFLCIIFFVAILSAALTSLINLFETPIETLQYQFGMSRKMASLVIVAIAFLIGIFIEDRELVGKWMDIISIYVIPLGALLAGIMFFWVCGKGFAEKQLQSGLRKPVGRWFGPMTRYVFVGLTFMVYILGILYGGIG